MQCTISFVYSGELEKRCSFAAWEKINRFLFTLANEGLQAQGAEFETSDYVIYAHKAPSLEFRLVWYWFWFLIATLLTAYDQIQLRKQARLYLK